MADVTKIKLPDNSEYNLKDHRIPGVDTTPTSGSDNVVTSGGIYDAMTQNEYVVAAAINDLNDRLLDVEDSVENTTIPTKISDLENDSGFTSNTGTLTGVSFNGSSATVSNGVASITASVGDTNVIETVKVNGTALTVTNKAVDVPIKWVAGTGSGSIITEGSGGTSSGTRSLAEGDHNTASGNYSHAEGYYTIASGLYAHSEGGVTSAGGNGSHTEGANTVASNNFEHAQGRYNVSNKVENSSFGNAGNTIHSIGIGTGSNAKKNAVEVMQNGDAYLYGVGSYNGTNYSSATTLQDVINGKDSLPSVSPSDNGKVLTVVSGDWAAATASSGAGTLNTTATTAQTTSASEALSGSVILHKIAKTGTYSDLIGTPTIPTKVSDLQNDSGFTTNTGTLTGVTFNGNSATVTSGIAAITATIPTVPTTVSSFTNDANYVKYVLCANEAAYNAISNKDSGTLYLIPKT